MKKGDIVSRTVIVDAESHIPIGFVSLDQVDRFVSANLKCRTFDGRIPSYQPVITESGTTELIIKERAQEVELFEVQWIIGNEASLRELKGEGYIIVELVDNAPVEGQWNVVEEAEDNPLSIVREMTDEQLREAVEQLRGRRSIPIRLRRQQAKSEKRSNRDPVKEQLESLSVEDRKKLMDFLQSQKELL